MTDGEFLEKIERMTLCGFVETMEQMESVAAVDPVLPAHGGEDCYAADVEPDQLDEGTVALETVARVRAFTRRVQAMIDERKLAGPVTVCHGLVKAQFLEGRGYRLLNVSMRLHVAEKAKAA